SHAAIGDEAFFSVQYPLISMAFRLELPSGPWVVLGRQAIVGTGIRFRLCGAQQIGVVLDERPDEPFLLFRSADRRDQLAPLPALAESLGDGAVGFGELCHNNRLRHEIGAVPTPFLSYGERPEAELGAFLDDVPVESLARIGNPVALQRRGANLFLREF